MIDFTILTDRRYVNPDRITDYVANVLLEDQLLIDALSRLGFKVHRTNWDDPMMDWSSTKNIIFRTTWDYFDRFAEFEIWLTAVSEVTNLINSKQLIYWNIDKHYLLDIEKKGVRIPPTRIIQRQCKDSLREIIESTSWNEIILKPTISGAARHTFHLQKDRIPKDVNELFDELILTQDMMIQEYQSQIKTKGEVAFMVFGGKFSHAVLKMAKPGDFRVQDDFGGTLHPYSASEEEIKFVQHAISACPELPRYARVDVLWDNNDHLSVGEIELIEPELWFRKSNKAADLLAEVISTHQARS